MPSPSALFPLRIRAAREALHPKMSQRAAALRLSLSPSAINLYEMGKAEPSLDRLADLSRLYNVSTDWLLGLGDSKSTTPSGGSSEISPDHLVPVVSPQDLVRWRVSETSRVFQTLLPYSPQTAAAFIVGSDALGSVCVPGSTAVVSKGHPPTPGRAVLAVIGRSTEPVIRKFVREGGEDLLVADDPRFATYKAGEGAKIIGVITETATQKALI